MKIRTHRFMLTCAIILMAMGKSMFFRIFHFTIIHTKMVDEDPGLKALVGIGPDYGSNEM